MTTSCTPLQYRWILWEHVKVNKSEEYQKSMREICEFGTIEEFWKFFSYLPKPSDVFADSSLRKEVQGRSIDGFSLFKKGIRPEWEDPQNMQGCDIFTKKPIYPPEGNLYWENLVYSLIGETLEEDNEICGCRIVETVKKNQRPQVPYFRIEIWMRISSIEVIERIREKAAGIIAGDSTKSKANNIEFEIKFRDK